MTTPLESSFHTPSIRSCFRCAESLTDGQMRCPKCDLNQQLDRFTYTTHGNPEGIDDYCAGYLKTVHVVIARLSNLDGDEAWSSSQLPFEVTWTGQFLSFSDPAASFTPRVGLKQCLVQIHCSNRIDDESLLEVYPASQITPTTTITVSNTTESPTVEAGGEGVKVNTGKLGRETVMNAVLRNIQRVSPMHGMPDGSICIQIGPLPDGELLSGTVENIGIRKGMYKAERNKMFPDLYVRIWAWPDAVGIKYHSDESIETKSKVLWHRLGRLIGFADAKSRAGMAYEAFRRELDQKHLLSRFDLVNLVQFIHAGGTGEAPRK